MTKQITGPVVEGKLAGEHDLAYIPFSDTGGDPVIATEAYVDQKIGSGLKVYVTQGGEGYGDDRLPDVLIVDGSQDNDITATLMLTSANYRRFWFVNHSDKHEIHVYTESGGAMVVGGPNTTALIVANKDEWFIVGQFPVAKPTPVPQQSKSTTSKGKKA